MDDDADDTALIIFRELTEDDKQKLEAEAKHAESGGGARDFRFNFESFRGVFGRMFPGREYRNARTIFVGELTEPADPANPDGNTIKHTLEFWPPTPSRPAEGRVTQVYRYRSFQAYPRDEDGRIYLLIVQTVSGEVRAHYATEEDLRTNKEWEPLLRQTILDCAFASASGQNAVTGWIDFTRDETYCHHA